jgi:hypothetical protein
VYLFFLYLHAGHVLFLHGFVICASVLVVTMTARDWVLAFGALKVFALNLCDFDLIKSLF